MAFPTIAARQTKKWHEFVLKKSTTVISQVQSFTIDESITVTEETRLSDITRYQQREPKTSNLNVVIYLSNSMSEYALLMNSADTLNPATGWVGNEQIELTPDSTAADYTIEMYDSIAAGNLQGVWTIDNWNPISNNIPVGGDTGSARATVNGVCENLYYTPSAGIGST
jgi:hypothetical protein